MLWPYRSGAFRPAGDLSVVIAATVEAGNALAEAQFPIRVAPRQLQGMRYPFFQFYGNFPFTVSGALYRITGDPYLAWKLVTLVSLLSGAWFAHRLALHLSRAYVPSVIAGVVFVTSPYMFTDLNARGAFTELVAFNLVPACFYLSLRAFASRRMRYVPLAAVAWTLLGLSHNITYFYGLLLAAAFFAPQVARPRTFLPRWIRLALVGVVHALLILWYFLPQMQALRLLNMQEQTGNPYGTWVLNPLRILFAPVLTNTPQGASTANLGLQIGWPIVASVLFALLALARWRVPRRLKLLIVHQAVLFAIAFLLVWPPFDYWQYLPRLFWFVQFLYRLLIFVVLCGSVLGACALAAWNTGPARQVVVWVVLLVIGMSAASYIPHGGARFADAVKSEILWPQLGKAVDEAYLPSVAAAAQSSWASADCEQLDWDSFVRTLDPQVTAAPRHRVQYDRKTAYNLDSPRPVLLVLPVLWYPRLLEVKDNGTPVDYGNIGRFLALRLSRGHHALRIRFIGVGWANRISAVAWIALLLMPLPLIFRRVAIALQRFRGSLTLATSTFSPRTAALAFVALFLGAGAVLAVHPIRRLLDGTPRLLVTASSQLAPEFGPENAFDEDEQTYWIAADSGPATLDIRLSKPARLRQIILQPRQTGLLEAWKHIGVVLLLNGDQVLSKNVTLPNAAHQPLQRISIAPTLTDRIELHFSSAITETQIGGHVPLDAVKPGYTEIQLKWQN